MPPIYGETCGRQMRDAYTAHVDELHLLHVGSGVGVGFGVEAFPNMPQVLLNDVRLETRCRFLDGCDGPSPSDCGDGGGIMMALSP